jgi:transcriptional regulator with XRE-family HTH domain
MPRLRFPIDTAWFKTRFQQKGLTQQRLAEFLKVDDSAIYRILYGLRAIWIYEAVTLARLLDVSVYEIMQRAGAAPLAEALSLPLVGSLNGALDMTLTNKYPPVTSIPVLEQSAVGVICDDNASPYYGWIFVYVHADDIQPAAVGRLSMVTLPTGKRVIRFLKNGVHAGAFDLATMSGPLLSNFAVYAASPILFIRPAHGP